ncbi:ABC transporter permease [Streptomyces sp. ISL-22]|uniref:Peptide ABC transporter permease n=2 Tax=Streptomyces TaxID=1883 RepID=A0A117PF34_9ACTN|nr:peptide ABC transporter permease [Streptomyces curacoi]MBT2418883.1 ABC transporter permease [Streptomyces sp. ISL-24]MBT2435684.1 ABC transporter permease [Streptomyces sp. ISL-22]
MLVVIAGAVTYVLAALTLDPRSNYVNRNPPPSPAEITATLDAYNLNPDTPVVSRFLRWAGDVLTGDLGRTVAGEEVTEEFGRRALTSTRLLLLATVVGSVGGVLLGSWNAVRHERWTDRVATLLSFAVLATPVFVTAVALQLWARNLNEAIGSTVFEYTGEYSPGATGTWDRLLSRAQHLVLPSIALVAFQAALFGLYQRNTMLDVLHSDFVRTARAKGLPRRTALLRHGLRVAVLPLLPLLAYNAVLMFTGTAFVEKIFGWHGMGEWLVDSVLTDDVNVVAAVGLFTAALVLVAGLLADVLHVVLDPRSRAS